MKVHAHTPVKHELETPKPPPTPPKASATTQDFFKTVEAEQDKTKKPGTSPDDAKPAAQALVLAGTKHDKDDDAADTTAPLTKKQKTDDTEKTNEAGADTAATGVVAPTTLRIERFDNIDDFNRAANAPREERANTQFEFGTYQWTTDETGRVDHVKGTVDLQHHGRHTTDGVDTTKIGKDTEEGAIEGDVGFHLVAEIFNGPINRVNVVPGNGQRVDGIDKPNLNGGDYKRHFETEVKGLAKALEAEGLGRKVEIEVDAKYNDGNDTSRFDQLAVKYRPTAPEGAEPGGWFERTFNNQPGGYVGGTNPS